MVLPWLAGAYAGYALYNLYNEGRAIRDYKRRYPWVRVKYPNRLKAYKAVGSVLNVSNMYGGYYYGRYSRGRWYY